MPPTEPAAASRDRWATARAIGLAILFALGVRVGVAQAYVVDGPSMEPSLVSGQRLLVLRAAYGLSLPFRSAALATWATPRVGDVVVIESPVDGLDLVKRVVGVPGDVIEIRDGVLYRNGAAAAHDDLGLCDPSLFLRPDPGCHVLEEQVGARRWRTSRSVLTVPDDLPPLEVPEGRVFVMGDHRDRSNDSRAFGPVPTSLLRGRVLLVD